MQFFLFPSKIVKAYTYSNELNQGVVDEGSFGQEEAAARTEVVEEEQVLLLKEGNRFVGGKLRRRLIKLVLMSLYNRSSHRIYWTNA